MTTVADHLESAIHMSNLMLKYIPQESLLYRNMALMQKALFFSSALNKGSYAYNGFGHDIVLMIFLKFHGKEPPRKKVCVVKSVPYTMSKKPQTATKVARKTTPTASTSEQDPDYEPPQGGIVMKSLIQKMLSIL